MKSPLSRREFFRRAVVSAPGLEFGVSLFDGYINMPWCVTEEEKHALLIKGCGESCCDHFLIVQKAFTLSM